MVRARVMSLLGYRFRYVTRELLMCYSGDLCFFWCVEHSLRLFVMRTVNSEYQTGGGTPPHQPITDIHGVRSSFTDPMTEVLLNLVKDVQKVALPWVTRIRLG